MKRRLASSAAGSAFSSIAISFLAVTSFLSLPTPTLSNYQVFSSTQRATILGCIMQGNCNGHGTCDQAGGNCICFNGYGSPQEASLLGYRPSYDCTAMTCPFSPAWGHLPTASTDAHPIKECAGVGMCDRALGVCTCPTIFRGIGCDSVACPGKGDCSKRGRCLTMKQQAKMKDAFPLSSAEYEYDSFTGDSKAVFSAVETWDQDRISSCVCDSSWAVGLGAGERQVGEFFGPECMSRRCPSGDNPDSTVDETNCAGVYAEGGRGVGAAGNLCHYDCSGRGMCDYKSGVCECFRGYYGENCGIRDVLATGK